MFFLFLLAKLTPDKVHEFVAYVKEKKEKWQLPGTVYIGIVNGDKEEAHFVGQGDVTHNSIVPIASLTKAITATLICILAEKKLISLDDPIEKYYPDLKLPHNAKLTIKDILAHRTGMKAFSGDSLFKLGFTLDEIYQKTDRFQVKNRPQIDYNYQNFFIGLLEKVIEKVTHKSLNDVAKEYIFKPLNMHSAYYLKPVKWYLKWTHGEKNFPPFYIYGAKTTPISPDLYEATTSMGVAMSCGDLLKWLKYCVSQKNTLVSQAYLKEMFAEQTSFTPKVYDTQFTLERLKGPIFYGLGWFNMMYGHHKIHFHMASRTGIRPYIVFDPKEKIGLVIFHNYGGLEISLFPEAIRAKFLDLVYDYPKKDWVDELEKQKKTYIEGLGHSLESEKMFPTAHMPFNQLLGIYNHDFYGVIKIVASNNMLYMHYRGKKVALQHHNGNKFMFDPQAIGSFDTRAHKWVYFGYNKKMQMTLQSNIMYEGSSPLFVKE